MMVLVTYDVSTTTQAGRRRLAQVAKTCVGFGQRVQHSVFECELEPARFVVLKTRLLSIIDGKEDSLRFYFLGSRWKRRVEHVGAKAALDLDGPLIA
jgi:CRISPR-associated protein Cas2